MGFGLVGQGGWGIQHGRAIMEEGADLALGGGGLGRASSGSHSPECALLSRPGLGTSAHGRPGRSQPPTRRLCPSFPRGRVSCLARTIDGNLRQRRCQVAACVARVGTYYEMRFSPLWCAVRDLIRSRPGSTSWAGWGPRKPSPCGCGRICPHRGHRMRTFWSRVCITPTVQWPRIAPLCAERATISYFIPYGPSGSIRAEWHGVTDRSEDARFAVSWCQDGDAEVIRVPGEEDGRDLRIAPRNRFPSGGCARRSSLMDGTRCSAVESSLG